MRKLYICGILFVFFAGFAVSVGRMENLRANGTNILLPLAPVDPRALLMGDYMTLDYAANHAVWSVAAVSGKAVMLLIQNSDGLESGVPPVARFSRLDDGTPLQEDEIAIAFKMRGFRVVTAAPAFYFAEGTGEAYARAAFGRVAVGSDGRTLLLALCDAKGRDIRPQEEEEK